MERPTEDAPAGHAHAWYSPQQAHNVKKFQYRTEKGSIEWVTETTEKPTPFGLWPDYIYVGIVKSSDYIAGSTIKGIHCSYDIHCFQ